MNRKDFFSDTHYLEAMCAKYNHYSRPDVPRTDWEHHRARTISVGYLRRIERDYRYGIDYRELGNGALLPYYNR